MGVFAIDNETYLVGAAQQAPKMVCLAITDDVNRAEIIHARDPACKRTIFALVQSGHTIVGHNLAFDVAVWCSEWPELLELVFQAYDADRMRCTMVRQKLLDIAAGRYRNFLTESNLPKYNGYDLGTVSARHQYPHPLNKADPWRKRYKELYGHPVSRWPESAITYPQHDARSTLWSHDSQESEQAFLEDQYRQVRAAFALRLISAWGIRTDRVMVARQRARVQAELQGYEQTLLESGFLVRDRAGVLHRRAKEIQQYAERYVAASPEGAHAPRTPSGKLQLDSDALAFYADDKILQAYQGFSSASVLLTRVAELESGIDLPIHTRFEELVETGRTSSSSPNIQNRGVKVGDRECFVPRRGFVFCDADFDGLELRTIAQTCLWTVGQSELAKVLNAGGDPHALIAARLLSVPLDDVLRRKDDPDDKEVYLARQSGKIANFGLAGGLGRTTLIKQARAKYKQILSDLEAKRLIDTWHAQWPEMRLYFNHVNTLLSKQSWVKQLASNRYRGDVSYTVGCNTYFQGLGADCTKSALYELVRECYVGAGVLRGSRVVNYVHDEYIAEVPEEGAHECAIALSKLVVEVAGSWLPDIKVSAKPLLTRRWSKKSKRMTDENGRLTPWEWDEAKAAGSPGFAT